MKRRDDAALLSDILQEAEVATRVACGKDLDSFIEDDVGIRAIERCLQIIGVA